MRLYSGPWFVLQTKLWILILAGMVEQPAVSISRALGEGVLCAGET